MVSPTYTFRLSQHGLDLDAAGHHALGWTTPCRVATTANITIATALNNGDTLDGVTLATGDRVLVKNQTTGSQNGIYVVGASPARADDYAASVKIVGSVVVVTEGTTNADTAWMCTTNAPITVATTALVFAAFGAGGGGGSMTVETTGGGSPVSSVTVIEVANLVDNGGGDVTLFPQITGDSSTALLQFLPGNSVQLGTSGGTQAIQLIDSGYTAIWSEHTPGAIADHGIELMVGTDYVGILLSEKDSGTMQIYPDAAGGYDVELVDRGTGKHWKMVTAAGVAAIPSMGMLPIYAAAPHSGTETEGESYYDSTLHKTRTWNGSSWNSHW